MEEIFIMSLAKRACVSEGNLSITYPLSIAKQTLLCWQHKKQQQITAEFAGTATSWLIADYRFEALDQFTMTRICTLKHYGFLF